MLTAMALAAALGGDASGNHVNAPGPGHSPHDRSMSVDVNPSAPDGFVVTSHAGNTWEECRDHIKKAIGLPDWKPNGHVPEGVDRGTPTHPKFGAAHIVYSYRSAGGELKGVVCRWDFPNGKEIVPAVPNGSGWKWVAMDTPRPLYRLNRLVEDTRQVLVVEGEKCADAAAALMPVAVTTWSGGSKAWSRTDWTPLRSRKVVLWPDNDKPGREAMQAIGRKIEGEVRIINPIDVPAKWDIADAIAAGWDAARLMAWASDNAKPWQPEEDNILTMPGVTRAKPGEDWRAGLVRNAEGSPKPRATVNFQWMLARHQEIAGCFAWNEMAREVYSVKSGPWKENNWKRHQLNDDDVTQCVYWLESKEFSPRPNEVLSALSIVSKEYSYNPIRDYLNRLVWDGVPRLLGGMWEGESIAPFPVEYFGTPDEEIYAIFMARWLVSAVARVMQAGCKADCMIVLEGNQERMKSSFLKAMSRVDGVYYFTDDLHDIENKDASISMQGIWIVEIAELNAFQRKDPDAIKAWLSRPTDRHRPPYGKMAVDFPRQCVIAGTMNPIGSGYLRDPSGARRFWPIPVRKVIDIKQIEADRDQVWAEAVKLYRDGYQWHLTEDEVKAAKLITEERYEEDPWDSLIEEYVNDKAGFTTDQVARAIGVKSEDQNKATSRRIGAHLRKLGWVNKPARINGEMDRKWRRET